MADDFTMFAGNKKTLVVGVKDNDDAAIDITAATIEWRVARIVDGPSIITKSIGSGLTITDAAAGIFEIALSPSDTEALSGLYYHEAKMTLGGAPSTIVSGGMVVEKTLIHP